MLGHRRLRDATSAGLRGSAGLAAAAALLLGAAGAGAQVRVTHLEGPAIATGEVLSLHSELAPGESVEVSRDGLATLLLDTDALVRLCEGGRARFAGPARVELEHGALGAVVDTESGPGRLRIDTPAARIETLGTELHVRVTQESGATLVSSLAGRTRVSPRAGDGGPMVLESGQQVTVEPGRGAGAPRRFERDALALTSGCLRSGVDRDRALARIPAPAAPGGAPEAPPARRVPPELAPVVAADLPTETLPLGAAATPSALISELNKGGLEEETCDPITCNPVYEVAPPQPCGDPPTTGCIP